MKEIALHIMDIVQNSITAKASVIRIDVDEQKFVDQMIVSIEDDGAGIPTEKLKEIDNPFVTSRTTRKVGMGLSLLKHNAELCDGKMEISSTPGEGTKVTAMFVMSHIDRPVMGDIAGVVTLLIGANPEIRFIYRHNTPLSEFELDTEDVVKELEGTPVNHPDIQKAIKSLIEENLKLIDATIN